MSLICPICQDNLVNTESVDSFVNKCGHVYHSSCLMPWWDQHHGTDPTCPECRQPCNMDTIQKIFFTLDPTEGMPAGATALPPTQIDSVHDALLRQIKEYITLQTCSQTKDINDKFRAQGNEFSSMLLNSNQRVTNNYNEKLTSVSKELTDVIVGESHRLLTKLMNENGAAMGDGARVPPLQRKTESGDTTDASPDTSFNYKRIAQTRCNGRQLNYIAIGIALMCLVAIIGYSHFILHALKKTEFSGEEKTLNVSKSMQQLSRNIDNSAAIINQNQRDIQNKLNVLHELLRTGINTKEVSNRLNELTGKLDKLLLEQIQTDRRTDYKLNVLQNEINMVGTQIDAGLRKNVTATSADQRDNILAQLKHNNDELQQKLQHLQKIIANNNNTTTAQLRETIENDPLLTPQSQRKAKSNNLWQQFTNAIGVDSGCGHMTAHTTTPLIVALALVAYMIQFLHNS